MTRRALLLVTLAGAAVAVGAGAPACGFDPAYRDLVQLQQAYCTDGRIECTNATLTRCEGGARITVDDCGARGQACAPAFLRCTPCLPNEASCEGLDVLQCSPDGQTRTKVETCKADQGIGCRRGTCVNLCDEAARESSNVGCEYWGVDLDNAVTSQGNAAAQQYAIVVSNVDPDLVATVIVEEDTAVPGMPAALRTVSTARVGPGSLEVFKLGPKEVDGSPPLEFDTGPGTALTRGAFRVRSDVPIVAYQFNPLENANVFSNDASLLLPTAALGGGAIGYVVAAWPQTIARSENADTNFGTDLRAFLTLVGTAKDTKVSVTTTARVIPGTPLPAGVAKGATFELTLQPFEVLNLETGDFNADFTGTRIDATAPIAVFAGSEASDAPAFASLASRSCCADHLEEQVVPLRSVGKRYVLGRVPNRSRAIAAAGGAIAAFEEPELYRVVATRSGVTRVTTSLPPPLSSFVLAENEDRVLSVTQDFVLEATQPVLVADVQVSQEAAGVVRGLPGGDPSLTYVTPVEQWRPDYVLLTPDKYAFDFLVITAPFGAQVFLDGLPVDGKVCEVAPGDGLTAEARKAKDPPFVVYRCQLSFPVVLKDKPSPSNVSPGRQNDGVHRVQADYPVGVLVYGFDAFVSYAYAAGTQLRDLNPR
jgi:hypothetical protein